jgi:hypothetical protein
MRIKSGMVMVLTIFLLLLSFSGALFAENKTALVIGNSSYQHFPVLSQPWREATAGSTTNIVVLDACRDNPLPVESRSAARGLARLDAPVKFNRRVFRRGGMDILR